MDLEVICKRKERVVSGQVSFFMGKENGRIYHGDNLTRADQEISY